MNVSLYATRLQAQVMSERKQIEDAYDRYPDATMFWSMIDLAGSSNFRLVHGPKEGYVRGETFFSLVRAVITPCSDVRLLKEIGDAALLTAPSFRPLLESIILIDRVAKQMAAIAGTQHFPFAVRCGISFGPGKRLMRRGEDFLSSSIDQLARLMGVRSEKSNLILHEEAFTPSATILNEYSSFLSVSQSTMLSMDKSKGMAKVIYYREVAVNQDVLAEFRDQFVPWRNKHTK